MTKTSNSQVTNISTVRREWQYQSRQIERAKRQLDVAQNALDTIEPTTASGNSAVKQASALVAAARRLLLNV
jgi:hypothetical protein